MRRSQADGAAAYFLRGRLVPAAARVGHVPTRPDAGRVHRGLRFARFGAEIGSRVRPNRVNDYAQPFVFVYLSCYFYVTELPNVERGLGGSPNTGSKIPE